MFSKREMIIFFAGAQTFHTISHIIMGYANVLPIQMFSINWTAQLNMYAIIINAVIMGALLWWAARTK